jgi:hypothetical protein
MFSYLAHVCSQLADIFCGSFTLIFGVCLVQQFFQDGARIEAAFRKYFHRADCEQKCDTVEILVCHANVIRYFVCRWVQEKVFLVTQIFSSML